MSEDNQPPAAEPAPPSGSPWPAPDPAYVPNRPMLPPARSQISQQAPLAPTTTPTPAASPPGVGRPMPTPATAQGRFALASEYLPKPTIPAPAPGDASTLRGLRIAIVVMVVLELLASGLLAAAMTARRFVWNDWVDGNATVDDLDDADRMVSLGGFTSAGCAVVIVILIAVWASMACAIARRRGATDARPVAAAIGWFIPIGNYWIGFNRLRRALRGVHGFSPSLGRWQLTFVLGSITSGVMNAFDLDGVDFDDVADRLTGQAVAAIASWILFALAGAFVITATREINHAIAPRPILPR